MAFVLVFAFLKAECNSKKALIDAKPFLPFCYSSKVEDV